MRAAVLLVLGFLAALLVQPGVGTNAAPAATPSVSAPSSGFPTRCCRAPFPTASSLLALGDSITAGTASTDGTGYRGPLDGLLAAPHTWVGSQGSAPLLHEGHPGWTCDQLADQARAWAALYRPAYALVDCGTNDDGLGRTAEEMLASAGRLLDEIQAGSPGTVIVIAQITLTPYNSVEQQQAEQDFDEGLPALAASKSHVLVVDMRGVHISADQVHPDDVGYQDMAARWAAVLPAVRIA